MPTIGGKSFTDRSGGSGTPIYQRTDGGTGGSGGSSTIISEITQSSPVENDYSGRPLIFLSDPIIDFSEAFNDHSKFKPTKIDIEGFFTSQNYGTKYVSLSATFLGFSDSANINLGGKMVCSYSIHHSADTETNSPDKDLMIVYAYGSSYRTSGTSFTSSISAWNSTSALCFLVYPQEYETSPGAQSPTLNYVEFFSRFINGKLYYACRVLQGTHGTTSTLEKATIHTTIRQLFS